MLRTILLSSLLVLPLACSPAATDQAEGGGFGRFSNRQVRQINRNNRQINRSLNQLNRFNHRQCVVQQVALQQHCLPVVNQVQFVPQQVQFVPQCLQVVPFAYVLIC